MIFQVTHSLCTLTLSRHELAALVAIASKDEARVNIAGVLLDPAARACVATDGHRLMLAVAGPAPFTTELVAPAWDRTLTSEERQAQNVAHAAAVAAEKAEHDRQQAHPEAIGEGREIVVSRTDAAAWIKACGNKQTIRITWPADRKSVTATIVDLGRDGATFTAKPPMGVSFPPWRAVMPKRPAILASLVSCNPLYLAEACNVLAKASGQKAPVIQLWAPSKSSRDVSPEHDDEGSLDPILVTMDVPADDGVMMSWRYVLMPVRGNVSRAVWTVPAEAAAAKTAAEREAEDERAAAE